MFRIKICGITNIRDAQIASAAGADAVGLNFFPGSKRYVDAKDSRAIVEALRKSPPAPSIVGVFVNQTHSMIRRVVDEAGLDFVQLHGAEEPELAKELDPLKIVRAVRVADDESTDAHLATMSEWNLPNVVGFLLDAKVAGAWGGTGRSVSRRLATELVAKALRPVVLAGGLDPTNVETAIESVRPWGVDVAGGVECAPGEKSEERVRAFVRRARRACYAG